MTKAFLGAFSLALLAVACGSESSNPATPDGGVPVGDGGPGDGGGGDCLATGSGSVTVEVVGLPAGATAKVTAGTKELTAPGTTTIDGGSYAFAAPYVTTADPRVRTAYAPTLSATSACVKNGETTKVTVTYAAVPTSNKLWTTSANSAAQLLAYTSANVAATSQPAADLSFQLALPVGTAFDKEGGLWMTGSPAGTVALTHYPASQLAATSSSAAPDITINGALLNDGVPAVSSLAFDPNGNLWVSTVAAKKILRYDAAQLKASGSLTPSVVITMATSPSALAFDKSGNLWAAAGGNKVVEYAAARLGASTSAEADVVLTAKTAGNVVSELADPRGLAFDASDNLWVNYSGAMARLTPADRASSGERTPAIIIGINVAALPEAIAFDEGGGLWFAYVQNTFARLSPAQLATSTPEGNSIDPATLITSTSIGSAVEVALYPAPANLPLFHRLP